MFGKDLTADVRSDTSGWYQKYLLALCQGDREDPQGVNFELAQEDASKLYEAGEKRLGTSSSFTSGSTVTPSNAGYDS